MPGSDGAIECGHGCVTRPRAAMDGVVCGGENAVVGDEMRWRWRWRCVKVACTRLFVACALCSDRLATSDQRTWCGRPGGGDERCWVNNKWPVVGLPRLMEVAVVL